MESENWKILLIKKGGKGNFIIKLGMFENVRAHRVRI